MLLGAVACAITTDILQLVGLKSFRVAGVMLVGLLLYDVFWVFGSPSAIGDNVSIGLGSSNLSNARGNPTVMPVNLLQHSGSVDADVCFGTLQVMLTVATSDLFTGPTRCGVINSLSLTHVPAHFVAFKPALIDRHCHTKHQTARYLVAASTALNLVSSDVKTDYSSRARRAAWVKLPAFPSHCWVSASANTATERSLSKGCSLVPGHVPLKQAMSADVWDCNSATGLGDIAVPGLLACLALRFDASRSADMMARAEAAGMALQSSLDVLVPVLSLLHKDTAFSFVNMMAHAKAAGITLQSSLDALVLSSNRKI